MGFTRYWHRQQTLESKRFALWVADMEELCLWLPPTYRDQPLRIAGRSGEGDPKFTADCVWLNGGEDRSYEAFYVPRVMTLDRFDYPDHGGLFFSFCKTGHMPYDLLVAAGLLQLSHRFGETQVRISADGTREVWEDGQRLCERVLGEQSGFMPYSIWKSHYSGDGARVEEPMEAYELAVSVWLDRGRNSA